MTLVNSVQYRLKRAIKAFMVFYRHKDHQIVYPLRYQVQTMILGYIQSCYIAEQLNSCIKFIELYEKKTGEEAAYLRFMLKVKLLELTKSVQSYELLPNNFILDNNRIDTNFMRKTFNFKTNN